MSTFSPDQLGTGRSYAEELDAGDPLAGFRDRFVRGDPSLIYLDGNSLGPLPQATQARIGEVVSQCSRSAATARRRPRRTLPASITA